mmetsp:Transcript_17354/g.50450  ORF Transcript_17354/g.50450 Transcript_17354/m.50450 type:complete len:204 (+) Transcript_17354:470-1081(+)
MGHEVGVVKVGAARACHPGVGDALGHERVVPHVDVLDGAAEAAVAIARLPADGEAVQVVQLGQGRLVCHLLVLAHAVHVHPEVYEFGIRLAADGESPHDVVPVVGVELGVGAAREAPLLEGEEVLHAAVPIHPELVRPHGARPRRVGLAADIHGLRDCCAHPGFDGVIALEVVGWLGHDHLHRLVLQHHVAGGGVGQGKRRRL